MARQAALEAVIHHPLFGVGVTLARLPAGPGRL